MKYQQYTFLSPVTFLIAFAGFFLTFTEINCNGQQLDTITGYELVTGYKQELDFNLGEVAAEQKNVEKYDPNIFALNAFIAAIIGLILMSVKKLRNNFKLVAIIAIIGFVCLIAMMIDLKSKISHAQNNPDSTLNIDLDLDFKMKIGYWLVTASFFIAAMWNILMAKNASKTIEPDISDEEMHQPIQ